MKPIAHMLINGSPVATVVMGRVTVIVLGLNLCWLLPCAWFLSHFGDSAGWILIAALLPVALLCWAAGSGRAEVC
jgi:hypothetical protein